MMHYINSGKLLMMQIFKLRLNELNVTKSDNIKFNCNIIATSRNIIKQTKIRTVDNIKGEYRKVSNGKVSDKKTETRI